MTGGRAGRVLAVLLLTAAILSWPTSRAQADGVAYTGWDALGGVSLGAPAATTWGPGRLDTFVRGSDANLWHKVYALGWGAWENLGAPPGGLASDPAGVAMRPGRVDVFAAGADGQLWHKWYENGWSGWEPLGGALLAAPAVASWASGRLDVFVEGVDQQLWHKSFDGTWSGWDPLGGVLTSAPAAVSWGARRVDVVVRGSDNQLWHRWYSSGWGGWEPLGGQLNAAPAVSSWGPGRLDLYARGVDDNLYHQWYAGGWSGWTLASAGPVTAGPGVVSWGPGRVDVFGRGRDDALYHLGGDLSPAGWTIQPWPGEAQLNAVSCPSVSFCLAAGYDESVPSALPGAVAEIWNGSAWTRTADPAGINNGLTGVSCPAVDRCVVTGTNYDGIAQTPASALWNGGSWTPLAIAGGQPDTVGFASVDCLSALLCYATSGRAVQRWTGGAWAAQFTAPANVTLNAVSCSAADACTAVGSQQAGNQTAAFRWNGQAWSQESTPPNPGPQQAETLLSVACASATSCVAVGQRRSSGQTFGIPNVATAMAWNGATWTRTLSLPSTVNGPTSILHHVTCVPGVSCLAVGQESAGLDAETWNGTTWTDQLIPSPIGSTGSFLLAVSGTTAVGSLIARLG